MRARPYLILFVVLAFGSAASSQTVLMQSSTDTLWIDSIATHSDQQAVLDVFFANADTINAIDLPLTYSYPDLIIDSVSFVGTRIEERFITYVDIDLPNAECHIGGIYFDTTQGAVGAGRGLFARIYITIPEQYPTRLIPFDTTRIQTSLTFVTKNDESYIPIFRKGYVNNTFAPTLDDSIWVDNIDVVPGEKFGVTIHAFNEHPIYSVKIPLEYQSDNIVFDSVSVIGTRAANAAVVDGLANDVQKKVLLTLLFPENDLMPPGSGPLAILYYTCQPSGTSTMVNLDTTEFEYGTYFLQLGSLFSYMKVYPDFRPGTITIDLSTDIDNGDPHHLPTAFSLAQNYPNPFNPTTSIAFSLPQRSRVVLDVFNILGQNVRRLVDETLPAGNHSVIFDGLDENGRELASGVYLYRVKTDGFTQSRKMMLMK